MKNLIFALIVLLAIAFVSQGGYPQKKFHKQGSGRFHQELKEKLNLTEEQEKNIQDLRLSHQEVMIKLRADIDLKELEMIKLKSSESVSRNEMLKLTTELNEIKNEIALARTNHQMDVYDNLDANQRKIWMETQEKIGHIKNKMKDRMRERRG